MTTPRIPCRTVAVKAQRSSCLRRFVLAAATQPTAIRRKSIVDLLAMPGAAGIEIELPFRRNPAHAAGRV